MRSRHGMIAVGAVAFAVVVGAGAFTTSERLGADGCPLDRDVMAGGPAYAADDPGYERISEAAAVVAKDVGYDPLTEDDLRRIEEASAHRSERLRTEGSRSTRTFATRTWLSAS